MYGIEGTAMIFRNILGPDKRNRDNFALRDTGIHAHIAVKMNQGRISTNKRYNYPSIVYKNFFADR